MQASNPHGDKDWDWEESAPVGLRLSKLISFLQCRNSKSTVILTVIKTDIISLFRQCSCHPNFPPQNTYAQTGRVLLQYTFITPLPDSWDLQAMFSLDCTYSGRLCFFPQEEHKISVHQSPPSWNFYLQLPVCLISNSIATVQHLCMSLGGKCQVCTYDGAITDLYYETTQTVTAKSISVRLPYLQADSRH